MLSKINHKIFSKQKFNVVIYLSALLKCVSKKYLKTRYYNMTIQSSIDRKNILSIKY